MSLKLRLMLIIGAVIVLLLVVANALSLRRAEEDSLREIDSTSKLLFALLPNRFAPASGGDSALHAAQDLLADKSLANTRHVTVEIRARSDELVWTTRPQNHDGGERPVLFNSSRLWTLPPLRKDIFAGEQPIGYFLVRPNPLDELREVQDDYLDEVMLTACVAIALGLILYWGMGLVLTPLVAVRRVLIEIESGNLKARLPRFSLPEMRQLSESFNRTVQSLEIAVAERQNLTQKLIGMEEETRRSLARDLHDELSPYLVAMQPHARLIANACSQHSQLKPFRESSNSLLEHLAHILGLVRNLLERLRPPEIEELGLRNALDGLVQYWRQHAARPAHIDFLPIGDWQRFLPTMEVSIYRIVQECLTNTFKHSDATRIEIRIEVQRGNSSRIRILVTDNGNSRGGTQSGGMGVLGMRERVQALGGSFLAGAVEGEGWQVEALLPFSCEGLTAES